MRFKIRLKIGTGDSKSSAKSSFKIFKRETDLTSFDLIRKELHGYMEMLLEKGLGARIISESFNAPIFGLHQISGSSIWMPIIEIYKRKNSDGQTVYSLEKALWIRRQNGEFERCEWNDELGAVIDKSHAYFKTETIRAAATFIESLPVPVLKTIQVEYQLYVPGISDTLKIMFAVFNSIAKARQLP